MDQRPSQLMIGDASPSVRCLAVHAMLAGGDPLTWSPDRENLVEGVLGQLDDKTRVELGSFMALESLLRSEALMLRSCKQVALDSEALPNFNAVLSLVQRFRECAASQQKPRWEQLQNVVLDAREQNRKSLRSCLARMHTALGPLLLRPLMQTLDGVSFNRICVFNHTQDKNLRLGGLGGDSEPAVVNFLERCVALALACPPTSIAPTQRNKKRKSSLSTKDQEEDTEKEPGSAAVNHDLSLTTLCTLAWDCCSSSLTSSDSIAETFPVRCETVGHAVAILIAQAPQVCCLFAHSLAAGLPPSGQLNERAIYLKFILLLVGSIRRSLRSRTQAQVQIAEGAGKVTDTRGGKGKGRHSASKVATDNARTSTPSAGSGSLPLADLRALETPLFELCSWAAGELLCISATEQNDDHDSSAEAAATHRPIQFAVFDAWELPMGSISSTIATDASECIPAALAEPLAFLQVHLCDPTVPPAAEVALLSDHYQRILLDSHTFTENTGKKTGTAGMDVRVGLVPNDWVASVASMVALCPSPRLALAAYRLARALSALVVTVSASANADAEILQTTPSILPTLVQLLPSLRPALVAVQAIKKQLYRCCPELLTRVLVEALSHALSALSLTIAGPSAVQTGKNANARSSTSSSQPEGLVQSAALSRLPPLLSSVIGTLLHFVSCDEHLVPMTSMLSACTPLCPLPRRLRLASQVTAECELSTKRVVGCARVLNAAVFLVACNCNDSAITQSTAAAVAAMGPGSESGQARPQSQSPRGVRAAPPEPVIWFQRLLSASPHAALCLAQSCLLLLTGRWDLGDGEGVFGVHGKEDLELPRWIWGGSLGPGNGSSQAMALALAQTFERVLRLVVEANPGVVGAGSHAVNTIAEFGDGAGVSMRAGEGVMGALLHLATQTSAFMAFIAKSAPGAPAHGPFLVRRVVPGEGDPSALDQNLFWSLVDGHEAAITASASPRGQIVGATGLQATDGTKHCENQEDQVVDIWPRAESALVSFINAVALARVVGGGGGAQPGSMDLSWLLAQVVGRLSCSPISSSLRQLARSFSSRPRRSHLGGLLRAFGVPPAGAGAGAGAGAIVDGHPGALYSALLYSPLEEEELLPVCGFARIESVAASAPRLLSTVSPFQIDLLLSGGGEVGGGGDETRDIVSGLGLVAAPSPFLGNCLVCEDWVSLTFAVLHVVKSRLPAAASLLGSGYDEARAGSCSTVIEPALAAVLSAHANKIILPALAHALRWHLLGLTPARARGCDPASVPHFAFSQIEATAAPALALAPASALNPVSESFLYVLACLEIAAIVSRTCKLTQSRLQFKLLEITWDETLTIAAIATLLCVSEVREEEGESVYAKERKQRPELLGVALARWLSFCSQIEAGAAEAATATGNGASVLLPLLSCGSLALATGVLDERSAWRRRLMGALAVLVPQQSGTLQPQQQGRLGLFEVLVPDAPAALHSAVPPLPSFADLWSALNQNPSNRRKQTQQRRSPPPPPSLTPVLLQELLLRGLPPVQGEGQDGEDALAQLMWAALHCCEAGSGSQAFPRWAWVLLVELMCAVAYSCTDLPSIGGQGQEHLGSVCEGKAGGEGGKERCSHKSRGRNRLLSSLCKILAGSVTDKGRGGSCSVGLLFVPSPATFTQLVRITCARLSVGINPPTPPPPLLGTGGAGAGAVAAMSTSELLVWLATASTSPNPDHGHSNSHSDATEALNGTAAGGGKHHNWPSSRPGPDPVTPDGDRDRAKGLHTLLQSFGVSRLAASPAAVAAAAAFSAQATTSRSPILLQFQIQAYSRPSSQFQPQSHQYQVGKSPSPAAVAAVSAAAIAAYYGTEPTLALSERLQDEALAPSLAVQPAIGFKRPREEVNKSGPSDPPTTQIDPLPAQDLQVTSVALMAQADGLGLEDPDEDKDEDEDKDSFARTLFTAVETFEAAAAVTASGLPPADLRPSSLSIPLPVPVPTPAPVPAAPIANAVPEHDPASAATEAWGLATSDLSKKFGSGSGFF